MESSSQVLSEGLSPIQYGECLVDTAGKHIYAFFPETVRYTITDTGISEGTTVYTGHFNRFWAYIEFHFPRPAISTAAPAGCSNASRPDAGSSESDGIRQYRPIWHRGPRFRSPRGTTSQTAPSRCGSNADATETVSYQWLALDGQSLPDVSSSRELILPAMGSQHLGRYQLQVTNTDGSTLSRVIDLNASDRPATLANLSGRAVPGTGNNALIAGFSGTKSAGTAP